MPLAGTTGQEPKAPAGQEPKTDDGQAPKTGSDEKGKQQDLGGEDLKEALAEARREAAARRTTEREALSKLEKYESEKRKAEEADQLKRGEHEKVIETQKATIADLKAQLQRERTQTTLQRKLAEHRPRSEAMEDILRLFPADGLDLSDEKAVNEKIGEFKKSRPYFFEAAAGATGLPGSRPANGGGGSGAKVTPEIEAWGKARGLSPEDAAEIYEKRQRARSAQS